MGQAVSVAADELRSDEAADLLTLDPDKSTCVFACGRKNTGKTHLTTTLFRAFPYDRLLIDVTGDVDPFFEFTEPIDEAPDTWPTSADVPPWRDWGPGENPPGERVSLRLRPRYRNNVRSKRTGLPMWLEQVDDWIGLAMDHGRTAVEIDDAGEVVKANRCGPATTDMLHTLRHRDLTLLTSCPRPVSIDPLTISQADLVAIFDTPHELDVRRLKASIGVRITVDDLYGLIESLDEHEFLLVKDKALYHCEPLPA
jgi:hypothetical protein